MSEKNHRLVILGSMDEFVDLVECAKKRGIYTIVCDGYEDGPAKAHADKAYLEDVRHTDAIAEICRKEPVSYTHLDVYKRQSGSSAGSWPWKGRSST